MSSLSIENYSGLRAVHNVRNVCARIGDSLERAARAVQVAASELAHLRPAGQANAPAVRPQRTAQVPAGGSGLQQQPGPVLPIAARARGRLASRVRRVRRGAERRAHE